MDWNTAFDQTLKEFGLSAKWLSERSNLSQQSISKFRNGHCPMTTDNLNALLMELPFEARERFLSLVLGKPVSQSENPTIEEQTYEIVKQGKKLPREIRKKVIIELVESLAREPAKMAS